jgi:hypothetical protein
MYGDDLLTYMSAQAFTDTAVSESVLDHTLTAHDLGSGEEVRFRVSVAVAGANFTSFVITLLTDGDEAFGSAVTLYTSPTIVLADITLGAVLVDVVLPRGAWERYSRVTVTFSDAGTCSLDAGLHLDTDSSKKLYPSGSSIE